MTRPVNRRHLAGASGAALLIGLAGPAKAAELDGELLARVSDFVAFLAAERTAYGAMTEAQRRDADTQRHQAAFRGIASLEEVMAAEIARIPARTPEGARAKARALVWHHGGDDVAQAGWALGTGLFESLLADLTGSRCTLGAFPRARVFVAPNPDAAFLAHLDAYDALQAEANAILAACGDGDLGEQDKARLDSIYDAQQPAAEGMIASGCTTFSVRRRLAQTLARQGYWPASDSQWCDNPRWCAEDRLQALLVRSAIAATGDLV